MPIERETAHRLRHIRRDEREPADKCAERPLGGRPAARIGIDAGRNTADQHEQGDNDKRDGQREGQGAAPAPGAAA